IGAQLKAHHLLCFLRFRGEHKNRNARTGTAQFATDIKSVFAGQHDVQKHQIEGCLAGPSACSYTVADYLDLVAFHLQVVLQAKSDRCLIFDQQNTRHDFSAAGRTSVNVLPSPGSLSTLISPRWAIAISRAMVRPTPVPLTFPARAALPRTNFLKMAFCSKAGIPRPRSRTRIAMNPFSLPHSTDIAAELGEYLRALSTRLRRATATASRSAATVHCSKGPLSSICRPEPAS